MARLQRFFTGGGLDLDALVVDLDSLSDAGLIEAVRSLRRRQQALLFESASAPAALDELVPKASARPVLHHGRNSLPLFSHFEKHLIAAPSGDRLWGFNRSSASALVGPGYFSAYSEGEKTWFDYEQLPAEAVGDGGPVRPNRGGLAGAVFGGLRDEVRRVTERVSIGRAFKSGKPIDAWFVLVRESLT